MPPVRRPSCSFARSRGVMPQLSDTEWKHTRPRHPVAVPASYPKASRASREGGRFDSAAGGVAL